MPLLENIRGNLLTLSEFSALVVGLLGMLAALWLYRWVKKQPADNQTVLQIGGKIMRGANTFLKREYLLLARFAGVAAVL
ncbi:MAG TPA: sodium/proton-translocating pyrophosphatase, partial [Clostridiales bacterium]|nr:sodium/proton-translocating pyrophosphatase [Clostridiales bacterium]